MIAQILPLRPVGRLYTYELATPDVAAGQIVRIPFGKNAKLPNELGIVWEIGGDDTANIETAKLKKAYALDNQPPLPDALRQLIDWTAAYTLSMRGMVAKMAVPLAEIAPTQHHVTIYKLTEAGQAVALDSLTAPRRKVIEALRATPDGLSMAQIHLAAAVSASVPKTLVTKGLITAADTVIEPIMPHVEPGDVHLPDYSDAQQDAADQLRGFVRDRAFKPILLAGVTGSGKTEVYFAAVLEALQMKRQALVLVPEITLTATFLERFTARFGIEPVIWHSTLTPAQRRRNYQAITNGTAQVVIGARSALFLPYQDLGAIVIDEEHDASYKQEEMLFYNARDLGIKRAQLEHIPVMLVSATPSLEA